MSSPSLCLPEVRLGGKPVIGKRLYVMWKAK